jgi:hypothetical protein
LYPLAKNLRFAVKRGTGVRFGHIAPRGNIVHAETVAGSSARAVSNHEGGPWLAASPFETHRTVGKCRLFDAPQGEVDTGNGTSAKAGLRLHFG